jgi:hypothetical protein
MFLELLLHCEHVVRADKFVAFNSITSKANILFCIISYLKTVVH